MLCFIHTKQWAFSSPEAHVFGVVFEDKLKTSFVKFAFFLKKNSLQVEISEENFAVLSEHL